MKDLEQYFTPQWLVDLYFQHVFPSIPVTRILDPACGAGAFENGFHRNLPERTRSDAKNYVEFMTSDIDPKYCTTPRRVRKMGHPCGGYPL